MSAEKGAIRVLFIDDDRYMQELLGMVLEAEGFEVARAANGAEGKAVLADPARRAAIDVIMVDLMMPVMDGLRFLRWLREEAKSDLPALVLTGRHDARTVEMVKQAGGDALLFKPADTREIVAQLRQLAKSPA